MSYLINNMNKGELITYINQHLNNLPKDLYLVYYQEYIDCKGLLDSLRKLALKLEKR